MNKTIEISKYIVNYANEKGLGITNLKLQKLLYYVQAAFLLLSDVILPRERVINGSAWILK